MFLLDARLNRVDDPFTFFDGGPLLSAETLAELNATLPDHALYSREIKVGAEFPKNYNMWRYALYENGARTESAAALAPVWRTLLDEVLGPGLRDWLTAETGVALDGRRMTVGLYGFDGGDYTTIDHGKLEKALSMALYLNDVWAADWGGNLHLWRAKAASEPPARTYVPMGGLCVVAWWGAETWHSIGPVRTGCSRLAMMIEYWKD